MKVVVARRPGGSEVLEFDEHPEPTAGPGELLVDVHATALNRADISQRAGTYSLPAGSTDVLGLEISGRVVGVGPDVDRWAVGDRVCGLMPGGGHAELAVLPADLAMPIPDRLDYEQAAALPEAFLTAYDNIMVRGGLQAGSSVLIHGGASGVGTAAIQLARHRGCRVIVTCGSPAKIEACRALGADVGIDYRQEDFVARVLESTGGRGVDVILDHIGGPYFARNLDALAMDGRLVIIGTMGGRTSEIDVGKLMDRRVWVTGSRLRPRTPEQKSELVAAFRRDYWAALTAGDIAPVVDAVLPWDEIREAHDRMESGAHVGKIVLRVK